MCGFVGFIDTASPHGSYDAAAAVKAMADRIAHRGPDGEGYFIEEDGLCALGFRRLSIIDLKGGDQPLYNEDGRLVLCFNGEIYNYRSLRAKLIARGHVFTTDSDSETVLHGYEEWGEDVLEMLRGMFAFVIYDRDRRRLFGARDAFGIKPFYYQPLSPLPQATAAVAPLSPADMEIGRAGDRMSGTAFENSASATAAQRDAREGLLFASEIKGMLGHPRFHKACNVARIPHYLCFEYLPDEETLFENVLKLPAGHFLTWENGRCRITRWFKPSFAVDESLDEETAADRIEEALCNSVQAHTVADVEVGGFLSAGVDSSLTASLASRSMDLRTFSVGWSEQEYSELDAASAFADIAGIENAGRTISAREFFGAVGAVQYAMDEPLPNPSAVPLWFLSRFAAEHVKVVLSGEGADELFGGYPIYQEALSYGPYMRVPGILRSAVGAAAAKLPPFHGRRFLMRGAHGLDRRFARAEYVFTRSEWRDVLAPSLLEAANPHDLVADVFAAMPASYDEATRMQEADIQTWMAQDILLKADKISMAASLELRVPFLDKEVWRTARSLPTHLRVRKDVTKPALRSAAARILPPETAAMPKIGFLTPLNRWLAEEPWRTCVEHVLNGETAARYFNRRALNRLINDHVEGKAHNMRRIWAIYCFCVWHDLYFAE